MRRVTQDNKGKKTAGIDGKKSVRYHCSEGVGWGNYWVVEKEVEGL